MAIGALVKPVLYVLVLLTFALLFYYGAWPVVSNEVMSRMNSGKSVPLMFTFAFVCMVKLEDKQNSSWLRTKLIRTA